MIGRWRDHGDQDAATELFNRYVNRLIALARKRLAPVARRVEAEDVVQSAYKSFFVRVRDGRLVVPPGGELWDLLAAITVNKVRAKVKDNLARKRDVRREEDLAAAGACWLDVEAVAREPSVEEELALVEECQRAMTGLAPHHRRMIELRLEQFRTTEIAAKVSCSDRMVRVVLKGFGKRLQKRLAELAEP